MEKHTESLPKGYELLGPALEFAEDVQEIFCRAPLLEALDISETRVLCNFMVCCAAPRGMTLLQEGGGIDFMFFLLTGRVDVSSEDEMKLGRPPSALGPGSTIAEMAMIDGAPCDHSYTAVEPVDLVLLTRKAFKDILMTYPRLGNKLLLVLLHSLSDKLRMKGVGVD